MAVVSIAHPCLYTSVYREGLLFVKEIITEGSANKAHGCHLQLSSGNES